MNIDAPDILPRRAVADPNPKASKATKKSKFNCVNSVVNASFSFNLFRYNIAITSHKQSNAKGRKARSTMFKCLMSIELFLTSTPTKLNTNIDIADNVANLKNRESLYLIFSIVRKTEDRAITIKV